MEHPRDRYLTVYGRKPVLEVLEQPERAIARVFVATNARGDMIRKIRAAARARGVEIVEKRAEDVSRISRRPKQDQGVAADVEAPAMGPLEAWLEGLLADDAGPGDVPTSEKAGHDGAERQPPRTGDAAADAATDRVLREAQLAWQ